MKEFSRWPLAMLSFGLIATAVTLDITSVAAQQIAGAIEVLGIVTGGAFIYAEGARHRDWFQNSKKDDTTTPDTEE